MAAFMNVFISTAKPLEALVSEIGTILGVELSARPGGVGALYGADYMGMDVSVFEATDYEADRDMDFPSYQIEIDIGPLTGEQSHDDRVREAAVSLARRLRQQARYATIVTVDLQRVVERHDG